MGAPSVLLIAEAANPEWVSVPLVGWCLARAIAKFTRAHLVTHVRNREAILHNLGSRGFSPGSLTFIDSEKVDQWAGRVGSVLRGGAGKGWTTVTALKALSYYYFEDLVWRLFEPRIRAGEFDLVHRLTPLSPTIPSLMARRSEKAGVPFVLGPLNGGLRWPAGFDSIRRKEKEWLSYLRFAHKLLPGYRSTRDAASAILLGSAAAWREVPVRYHEKCFYLPENGFDPERFQSQRTHQASRPLRAIFVGRLVPYKGLDLLLEAAAPLVRAEELSIEIVGEGPERDELEGWVRNHRMQGGVSFSGWVDHSQLSLHLSQADLFVFPSLREFGGGAIIEAMAAGLVPLTVDYGGPGELVTPETGFLIPMQRREGLVQGLRNILLEIVKDPSLLEAKSPLAQRRAHEHFTWEVKAERIVEIYRWVLEGRTEKGPQAEIPEMEAIGWMR